MLCALCGTTVSESATVCPVCGAPLAQPSLALPVGTKLAGGKYTVGKVLGQGGFGITYLGADTTLSRPVAVKEFFPQGCSRNGTTLQPTALSPDDFLQMKQRFLEEAQVLARLSHSGIVKVYDFFAENNTAYMVMEYLQGSALSKVVEQRGRLSESEAVGYILKVCEALEVVHGEGYLHRDIKPDNIFVCQDGRVVLIDFGAVRQFVAGRTGRHTVILTPGFAPLEQYSEQAKRGAYTDIYALGATLYYMLTGQVPVDAAARASGVPLQDVRSLSSQVSENVSDGVMKALEMEVSKRPQSVKEFVGILQGRRLGVSSGVIKPSQGRSIVGQLVRTLRGHTGWVRSVAFSSDGQLLASGSDDKTIKLWRVSDGSLVRTLWEHTKTVYSVAFSPDGQLLASGSADNTIKLWRVSDGRLVRTLKGHTEWVCSVAFSPDGQLLASVGSWDRTIILWRVSDGSLVRTLTGHTELVNSVAFSPDGQLLASGSWDRTIKLWRVWDGSLVGTLRTHKGSVYSVTFSPDGQLLASGSADNTIKLWRVSDGSVVRTLKGHTWSVFSVTFSPDGQLLASGGGSSYGVGEAILWRVSDGSLVGALRGHTDDVNSITFSPDGQLLASGSRDRTIKLWQLFEG